MLVGYKEVQETFLNGQELGPCLILETHIRTRMYIKIKHYLTYEITHPANAAHIEI